MPAALDLTTRNILCRIRDRTGGESPGLLETVRRHRRRNHPPWRSRPGRYSDPEYWRRWGPGRTVEPAPLARPAALSVTTVAVSAPRMPQPNLAECLTRAQ